MTFGGCTVRTSHGKVLTRSASSWLWTSKQNTRLHQHDQDDTNDVHERSTPTHVTYAFVNANTHTHTVTHIIFCNFFVWSFFILVVIICINLFVYRFGRVFDTPRLFQPHRSWTIESRRIARLHTQPNSQENPCQHHVPAQKFRIVNDLISCAKSIPNVSP